MLCHIRSLLVPSPRLRSVVYYAVGVFAFQDVVGNIHPISDDKSIIQDIHSLVQTGQLSRARRVANECLSLSLGNVSGRQVISSSVGHCPPSDEILQAFKFSTSLFYQKENFLDLVIDSQRNSFDFDKDRRVATLQSSVCWDGKVSDSSYSPVSFGTSQGSMSIQRWNDCCSFYRDRQNKRSKCVDPAENTSYLCCEFSSGSENHLVLPALKEPFVTIRVEKSTESKPKEVIQQMIRIEQEGQLALYDVSGVLWPAGYLLGLCLYDPVTCGVPEIINITRYSVETNAGLTFALELGAGVGFPSIAFAKYMSHHLSSPNVSVGESPNACLAREQTPVVVATDSSRSSLGLIAGNSYHNNVGHLLDFFEVDHMNPESISNLLERIYPSGGGFDLIFGSSLQGFFDESSRPDAVIWRSLDLLLSKTNSDAIVLLSHVRSGDERIEVPNCTELKGHASNLFEIVRRISGDVFQMRTRDGLTSDFEIVVIRRQK
ncbi:hypothetical protein ACHAW6_001126 [Cyclotella cf. meneghiniana]